MELCDAFTSQTVSANDPTVALLSGGVDSTTLLYVLHAAGASIRGLFVDYAQRTHDREFAAVTFHTQRLGINLTRLDLTETALAFLALQHARKHVPLPHRNAVILGLACSFAAQVNAPCVDIAVTADDLLGYASASAEFLTAFDTVGRTLGITLRTRLIGLSKHEVVLQGKRLGVAFEQTHSCMRHVSRHCGTCSQCQRRRTSFAQAGVLEPHDFYLT